MSNSGKLALQLGAAHRAARPTTELGASLPGAWLGATRCWDRRGHGRGRGPGQQPGNSGTRASPGRQEERAERWVGAVAETGARGPETAGSPRPGDVPGAGHQGPLRRCSSVPVASTAGGS